MALYDINQIYQAQFGTAGEPIPNAAVAQPNGAIIRSPLKMAVDGKEYTFQFEPLVSVFGRNTVIRNHILKGRSKGTVKEYWSADDYSIEIKGVVQGDDPDRLPIESLNQIRYFCEVRKAIEVNSPYLTIFGIQFISIEDFGFTHTPGYNNQIYVIKGYSDEPFEIF